MPHSLRALVLALGTLTILGACSRSEAGSATDSGATAPAPALAPAAHAQPASSTAAGDSLLVTVYKSPTCGCCSSWVDYMRGHGYKVVANDLPSVTPVKRERGITADLESCHTAIVGGYVVEGHVPVEDIRKLLAERPDIIGIAAPGMPRGSPGMEGPVKDKYDVLAIGKDGSRKVFASH